MVESGVWNVFLEAKGLSRDCQAWWEGVILVVDTNNRTKEEGGKKRREYVEFRGRQAVIFRDFMKAGASSTLCGTFH